MESTSLLWRQIYKYKLQLFVKSHMETKHIQVYNAPRTTNTITAHIPETRRLLDNFNKVLFNINLISNIKRKSELLLQGRLGNCFANLYIEILC